MVTAAWFFPAMLALTFWGVSAFLPKLAVKNLQPLHVVVYSSGFSFLCTFLLVACRGFDISFDLRGVFFGVTVGVIGTLGQILYLFALRQAKMTGVIAVSALYPMIATLLAFLVLGETLTSRQMVGISLGVCALVLTMLAQDQKIEE